MKKIICIFIIAAMCMALVLPAAATEIEEGTVALEETLTATEGADEAVSTVETAEQVEGSEDASEQVTESGTPGTSSPTETEPEADTPAETVGDTGMETEATTVLPTESETEDIAAIIGGADNRLEAIVGLANAMGITLEEAEAILDKMAALGDEHLGENDIWIEIKDSILENPETWTVVVLVVLMLIALAIFLIRGQIKNTSAQATTKANIIDIKKNEAEITGKVNAANTKLAEIEREHGDIKLEMDEIYEVAKAMLQIVEESKAEADKIYEMAALMLSNVDTLKSNSESALNVNRELALQTVQLLNIAMGRQLPRVSESTRKVWYEDAVARIKAAAGVSDEAETAASTPDPAVQ